MAGGGGTPHAAIFSAAASLSLLLYFNAPIFLQDYAQSLLGLLSLSWVFYVAATKAGRSHHLGSQEQEASGQLWKRLPATKK